MKNLILLALIMTAISCSHQNQRISLDLVVNSTKSNIGEGVGVNVAVIDDRQNKEIIGTKRFGDEKINILLDKNLSTLIQQKIVEGLVEKGFKKGGERLFELHIETLDYKAKRRFFIGTSKANIIIKATIKQNATNSKFSKKYSLSLGNKHFIVPLESTDTKTITSMIQEVVGDIVNDSEFLKNLTQSSSVIIK